MLEVAPDLRILTNAFFVVIVLCLGGFGRACQEAQPRCSFLGSPGNGRCWILGIGPSGYHWMVAPVGDQARTCGHGCFRRILCAIQLCLPLVVDFGRTSPPFDRSFPTGTMGCPSLCVEASDRCFRWFLGMVLRIE